MRSRLFVLQAQLGRFRNHLSATPYSVEARLFQPHAAKMHTLIVVAHPDKNSYTHAATAQFIAGLQTQRNNTYEVVDLNSEKFDPLFTIADNDIFHRRISGGNEIVAEQKRIEKADLLVLVFPVYWWSMPAVMKGWIDRVFCHGWAFEDDPKTGTTRLLGKLKGQVLAVGGSARQTYERRGYLDAMHKQIVEGIFGFCGMQAMGMELLLPMDELSETEGLKRAFEVGQLLSG